jgi:putative two-component system response regulator
MGSNFLRQSTERMNKSLLIVDDDNNVISSLKRALHRENYDIRAVGSALEGLEIVRRHEIGVVISDRMMPLMDGVQFLAEVKKLAPDTVRILLTGYGSLENAMEAIRSTQLFGYLTKPWSDDLLKNTLEGAFEHYHLIHENRRLQMVTEQQNIVLNNINLNLETAIHRRTLELEDAVREGIFMLAKAAEAKDDQTGDHINRIRSSTEAICMGLGMSVHDAQKVGLASIMHDIGKIHIPDVILQKQGPLTTEEWEIMKRHTVAGEKILGERPIYFLARQIARSHHERWDGSGYPDGLKEYQIPVAARIVTVADVYDALTHKRPYKPAWPQDQALAEMKHLSGGLFDPRIVEVFLATTKHKPMSAWDRRS